MPRRTSCDSPSSRLRPPSDGEPEGLGGREIDHRATPPPTAPPRRAARQGGPGRPPSVLARVDEVIRLNHCASSCPTHSGVAGRFAWGAFGCSACHGTGIGSASASLTGQQAGRRRCLAELTNTTARGVTVTGRTRGRCVHSSGRGSAQRVDPRRPGQLDLCSVRAGAATLTTDGYPSDLAATPSP
jgi:hypothetical protein